MEATTHVAPDMSKAFCYEISSPWCSENLPWIDVIIEIFIWFLAGFTVVGNLLVLIVFARDRELRASISNMHILNLAVADLLVGCISIPINNLYRAACWWPYSASLCRFWITMNFSECTVSVWAIVLISYDRCLLVTKRLEYGKHQTVKKFLILSAVLWIISYLRYFCSYVAYDWIMGSMINYNCDCYSDVLGLTGFVIYDMVSSNIVPIILIVYLNARLFWNIRMRSLRKGNTGVENVYSVSGTGASSGTGDSKSAPSRGGRELRRHYKAAVTLAVIVGTAFLCWTPYFTITILQVTFGIGVSTRVLMISYYIFYSNSGMNPLLYVATNPRIRAGIIKILKFQ